MARCYICNYCDSIDESGDIREGGRKRRIGLDKEGREICDMCRGNGTSLNEKSLDRRRARRRALDKWADAILRGEIVEIDDTKYEE